MLLGLILSCAGLETNRGNAWMAGEERGVKPRREERLLLLLGIDALVVHTQDTHTRVNPRRVLVLLA